MVKTLLSNARVSGSIPGWGAKILHASWPKKQNRSSVVTNSIKTLEKLSTSKNLKKKKKTSDLWNIEAALPLLKNNGLSLLGLLWCHTVN